MGIHARLWKLGLLALSLSFALHGAAVGGYLTNVLIAGHSPLNDPRALSFLTHGFLIQILELSAIFFVALATSEFYRDRIKQDLAAIPGESVTTAAVLSIFFAWTLMPYLMDRPQADRSIASDSSEVR